MALMECLSSPLTACRVVLESTMCPGKPLDSRISVWMVAQARLRIILAVVLVRITDVWMGSASQYIMENTAAACVLPLAPQPVQHTKS